jgi:dTDP-4-dehydrorhamnose 3,5-epimerase
MEGVGVTFSSLPVTGAYVIEQRLLRDDRGSFARAFCRSEFASQGLAHEFVQWNTSANNQPGTIRGLHYQTPPFAEAKLIVCTQGALCDVVVDVRPGSPTYCQWAAVELTAHSGRMVYVPEGCAHGYQALVSGTCAFYGTSASYSPDHEKGVRWNDPLFNIAWPIAEPILSVKDAAHPDFVR